MQSPQTPPCYFYFMRTTLCCLCISYKVIFQDSNGNWNTSPSLRQTNWYFSYFIPPTSRPFGWELDLFWDLGSTLTLTLLPLNLPPSSFGQAWKTFVFWYNKKDPHFFVSCFCLCPSLSLVPPGSETFQEEPTQKCFESSIFI